MPHILSGESVWCMPQSGSQLDACCKVCRGLYKLCSTVNQVVYNSAALPRAVYNRNGHAKCDCEQCIHACMLHNTVHMVSMSWTAKVETFVSTFKSYTHIPACSEFFCQSDSLFQRFIISFLPFSGNCYQLFDFLNTSFLFI